jgi:hypothetical protein
VGYRLPALQDLEPPQVREVAHLEGGVTMSWRDRPRRGLDKLPESPPRWREDPWLASAGDVGGFGWPDDDEDGEEDE